MYKYFTRVRLNSYGSNVNEYLKNIHAAQKIFPKLHIFEIILKNRIDAHFKSVFGGNWLTLLTPSNNTFPFVVNQSISNKVKEAERILQKARKPTTHDGLMGSLTLGFWVFLLDYNNFLKKYRLHDSSSYNDFLTNVMGVDMVNIGSRAHLKQVHDDLVAIRDFRNRVYHYERITHIINKVEKIIDRYLLLFDDDGDLKQFIRNANIHNKLIIFRTQPINKKHKRKKR